MGTKIIVTIEDDLYRAVKDISSNTGVAYSFVVRRALENWVTTGVVPARVSGLTSGEDGQTEPAQEEPVTPETRPSRPA